MYTFLCFSSIFSVIILKLRGRLPWKSEKNEIMKKWNYTFVLLQTLKFTLFSKKPYIIVFICGEIFLMEVINLAGLPDVGNTEKSRNL